MVYRYAKVTTMVKGMTGYRQQCARARVSDLLLSGKPLNKLLHVTLIDM